MKQFLTTIALLGIVGCVPQLPKVPEIPSVDIPEVEVPNVEVPNVEVPTVELPTTLPSFKSMCIAGFVETSPGVGTVDIYAPTKWSPQIQSISGVGVSVIPELELDPC